VFCTKAKEEVEIYGAVYFISCILISNCLELLLHAEQEIFVDFCYDTAVETMACH